MPLAPSPTRPEIPKSPQPTEPKQRNPKPKRKPRPRHPAPKSRVSLPHRWMADPAAVVPMAGNGEDWTPSFGDMVWGKVKSHPWWPGHVYSITLSDDPEVHRGHRHGLVLVAFFGDGSYGWFEPHELVRFEDHFTEKTSQGGSRTFPVAVAEALDEIARRSALALLCPCRSPDTFRPHKEDPGILLVNVPGFDSNAEYLPDQVTAAREKFVPQTILGFLQNAAVEQRDAAETAARTLPGIEMAAMLMAYRRSRFEKYDLTYAESFGVEPKKALEGEIKAEAERTQRARPLKGRQRVPEKESTPASKGRRGAAGAAARLMEKIMPGAPAIKPKASKKDQYLLKRRDDSRAPALPPAVLPDATPAPDDGGPPPGFPTAEPQTPPLPSSTVGGEDDEFMLQRRELPPAGQTTDGGATAAAAAATAPKKAAKPKKARKREREEGAEATADEAVAAGEPKTKKKKKKLAELNGVAPPSGGSAKPAAFSSPKVDLDGLDLKQVISDLQNLPLLPSYGAGRRISDASHSFLLAFRSKHYKKSYENDLPEESKKSLDNKPNAAAAGAATDGQPPKPAKKKQVMRPIDPTSAGVKRGPSDRQEEMASKKKIKLEKIKNLAAEKKAGLEQKDAAPAAAAVGGGAPAAQQPRAGMKEKAQGLVKKKVPAAAPAKRMASPTALMMKFPPKSTLPSVASLKARFARFGPLDIDGIRVYWKSHMCRVIYKFQSDAENALKYAKANAMFGQAVPSYHLRGIESASAGADPGPEPAPPQQQRSDLRLMETTPFRPGSSGNGAPLTLSRAAPARAAVGQPKSILKKSNDDGPASALRDSPRVKFMLDAGDSKLEPPALPASGGASNVPDAAAAPVSKVARSVGFAQQPLQPPARPAQPNLQPTMRAQQQQLQPPRALDTQQLPPPPPLPYQPRVSEPSPYQPRQNEPSPYQPRHTDAPPSFNMQPPYQSRHIDVPLILSGQPPLPYPPRAGFPGHQYSPRSDDMPPSHFDKNAVNAMPPGYFDSNAANAMPVWKRGEKEFKEELMRVMLGIAKLVEPLMDKNGNFPYHLFGRSA